LLIIRAKAIAYTDLTNLLFLVVWVVVRGKTDKIVAQVFSLEWGNCSEQVARNFKVIRVTSRFRHIFSYYVETQQAKLDEIHP